MTTKEKAVELISKMNIAAGTFTNELVFGIGRRSALVAVKQIIFLLDILDYSSDSSEFDDYIEAFGEKEIEIYWKEVKDIIEHMTFEKYVETT